MGSSRSRSRRWLAYIVAMVAAALAITIVRATPAGSPVVHVIPIHGEIDAGLAAFVDRAASEAEAAGAQALVLDIDTFGGRVDAAVVIRDRLLAARVPTIAFVNPRAISAGALIALAAEKIAVSDGATIGAAAPVQAGPGAAPEPAGEKVTSYVRKEFRATAEQRGRPAEIAEAMVDADVAIAGLVAEGKLLTLTTREAMAHGVADLRADNLAALLDQLHLSNAEVRRPSPNWAERLVGFVASPIVGSLLLSVGALALLTELRVPGFGVPGVVGAVCLVLFFWSRATLALVGWEEVALLGAGGVLIALEIFVVPGFGITGILGAILLFAGLTLSLVGAGVTGAGILAAAAQIAAAALVALVGGIALLRVLPHLPFGRRMVLGAALGEGEAEPPQLRIGARGTALSPLRPAGIADLGGTRTDVVSQGEYVLAGEPIEVTRVEDNRIVVRRWVPAAREEGS